MPSSPRTAGAAAWTFHTRQSVRLDGAATLRSLIQANATEQALLEGTPTETSLAATAQTGSWGLTSRLSVQVLGTGTGSVTSVSRQP